MTQLVKKDSSWRTLRRKAVVGASSLALVAGMGVALAPVASAADAVAPTVTVEAQSAAVSNDGTGTVDFDIEIDNTASGTVGLSGLTYTFTLAGVSCTRVELDTATDDIVDGTTTVSGCKITATGQTLAAGADLTDTVTVSIKATATTGTLTATLTITSGLATIASASDTTELNSVHAPVLATSVAAPKFGSSYDAKVVTDKGFIAVDEDATSGSSYYRAEGYTYSASTKTWTAVAARTVVNAAAPYTTGSGASAVDHFYIALNDTAPVLPAEGFYFDTATGAIVYGTLSAPAAGKSTFSPKPVSDVSLAGKTTWTIVATNGTEVREDATSEAKPVPALAVADVASPQFTLAFAPFSDVSDTNVFADAIAALAGKNIIRGYANGTFGVAQNITRGEFAKAAYGLLDAIGAGIASGDDYVCGTGAAATGNSAFSDVANTNVFCNEINTLAKAGVIKGNTNGTFSPNANITRDQIAAFIFRMNAYSLGSVQVGDAPQSATQFTDVPASNFASGDIAWGAGNGIINGRTATTFDPAGKTLRQEAAGLLYRFGNTWSVSW